MNPFPSIRINKNSPVPIYHQLQEGIAALIEEGRLKPGEGLPSENELSQAYKISPMTVRQAMAELVNEGYVYRQRGRGTFVSSRPIQRRLEQLTSFSEEMIARQVIPGSRLLIFEKSPLPNDVIHQLKLLPDMQMTRIKRVRLADENPVGIHDTYLYLPQITITRDELEQFQSLYKLLEFKGIHLREGEVSLRATAATAESARLLGVELDSPLLRITRISWDTSGKFVEFVDAQYRADLYQYTIHLKR